MPDEIVLNAPKSRMNRRTSYGCFVKKYNQLRLLWIPNRMAFFGFRYLFGQYSLASSFNRISRMETGSDYSRGNSSTGNYRPTRKKCLD